MKLRMKLFSAMSALVVFMAVVFLTISHIYAGNMFQQYALAARQGEAADWSAMLSYYYQQNQSWTGVDTYVHRIENQKLASGRVSGLEHLVIVDRNHVPVYISSDPDVTQNEIMQYGIQVRVLARGRAVGTVWVMDRGLVHLRQLQGRVIATMNKATVMGVLYTALAALLIGAWLTRLLTRPLKTLSRAIRRMATGDLSQTVPVHTKDEFGSLAATFNEMTAQLSRLEEVRRHLVADVAHELRTPLTIIQGQLELIQQGVRKPVPEVLLPLQDEVMRLTQLVGDLHQLTLAEAGKLELEKQETNMTQLLQRVVDNFQYEFEDKEIHLVLQADEPDSQSFVDPRRMTQVFINLIGNALRYTPRGGEVSIRVVSDGKWVSIFVTDTGPGIEATALPNIFERFYRIEEARSRGSGGMGLGLAIAKEFIEAHGGTIRVFSEVGKGTTFTVRLPRLTV